jgi:hypothetical protein
MTRSNGAARLRDLSKGNRETTERAALHLGFDVAPRICIGWERREFQPPPRRKPAAPGDAAP